MAAGIPQSSAGWPTTTNSYTNCGNHAAGTTLTSYTGYNGNGQAITSADARGVSTPSLYLGRVGCVQDAIPTADVHGACSSGANPFIKNTYDADPSGVTWSGSTYPVGHLTQSVAITYLPNPDNAQGTVTQNWQHDQRGRLITSRLNMAVTGGSLAFPTFPQYQQTQTYNDANQPMMMQTTVGGSAGYTTSQVYDGTTGTLTGLSNNSIGVANLATLSYNGQGLIGGMNYLSTSGSPVATSTMSYDPDLRPTGTTTTWQSNGTTLYNDQVSYDAVGNVLSRTAIASAVSGQSGTGGSEVQNFCYDEQNRLIWASNNAAVPSAGNGTCGNVTYQNTMGGNYTNQYVYTNLGQLWQGPMNGGSTQEQYLYCDIAHPHQLSNLSQTSSTPTCSSKGTVDYTGRYDSWGNTTSQVRGGITRTLNYDGLDHLVKWSSSVNSQQEWNLYDASGERVLRRTYDGTNTVLTVFAFGVEEHAYSYSGSGGNDTNTSNTYYYMLGGRTLGTWDGTSPGSPTTNFLLTDTLGSVVSSFNNLPNGAATVLGNQVYGPYGNKRVQQGTISTSKGYTGQFTDFVAGLDYYNARYYDPVVGVFVSADTVQGNMQGMNPYGYVGGNPETKTDPTGHRDWGGANEGTGGGGAVTPGAPTPGGNPSHLGSVSGGGGANTPTRSQRPKSSGPPVNQVVKALSSVAGVAGQVLWQALDLVFNVSGMWRDVQTLIDDNATWWAKAAAVADLGVTIFTDINMLDGEGEAARAAEIGAEIAEKGVADVSESAGRDAVDVVEAGCGGGLSFLFTTKVATQQGEQAIGTLKVGEKVWSYNPKTKKMELQPILHVWINHDNDLVDLTITHTSKQDKATKPVSEVIHTNKKHPFLTVEKGFLPVGQMKLGMHVVEADGQAGVISGWKVVPGVKTMYNLEVAQDHTFVVGMGQWVVHNCDVGRSGAFRSAKRDAGIPMGQQPDEVRSVGMTDRNEKSILDENGMPIQTREYVYTREDGTKIVIQDHSAGHQFGQGGVGDQGPHFNVRPIDETRNGNIPGTQDHYPF